MIIPIILNTILANYYKNPINLVYGEEGQFVDTV